jgi:hypothetical protein
MVVWDQPVHKVHEEAEVLKGDHLVQQVHRVPLDLMVLMVQLEILDYKVTLVPKVKKDQTVVQLDLLVNQVLRVLWE